MISINTNLGSLIVQNNLKTATKGLNQAIERMTTGFKINGAKDNAANFAISTQLDTKISAYNIAEENVSMGLDLVTTASDSLSQIEDKLSRIRALQEQASNGTYGEDSLNAINSEVNALFDEIERLYKTTQYNGINPFLNYDKSIEEVPASGFIKEVSRTDTSTMTSLASVDENAAITSGSYSISTAEELAKLVTMNSKGLISRTTNIKFVLANDIDLSAYSSGEGWVPIGTGNAFGNTFDGNGYVIKNLYMNRPEKNNQALFSTLAYNGVVKNLGVEDANITGNYQNGGIAGYVAWGFVENCYATGNVSGLANTGGLVGNTNVLTMKDCYSRAEVVSRVKRHASTGALIGYFNNSTVRDSFYYSSDNPTLQAFGVQESNAVAEDVVDKSAFSDIGLQVGINSDDSSRITCDTSFSLQGIDFLRGIGRKSKLTTDFLTPLDELLVKLSAKQTEYGAAQNRLESALEQIGVCYENLVSTRSTIKDADVAKESSEYIRNQILQQASATLLATANQTPSIALQLL